MGRSACWHIEMEIREPKETEKTHDPWERVASFEGLGCAALPTLTGPRPHPPDAGLLTSVMGVQPMGGLF